jgi:predicted Zn-dependent peptidase
LKEIYKKTVLENGIRVVTERIDSVRSISIGVWIDVGSRDEEAKEAGASHFIEHMLFKGTKRRTAREIAASLESVGGSLNAFTGREHTCYFARVLDEHTDTALDVLSDIIKNPLFNRSHLDRERQVIVSEIKELEDSPADLVHDLLMGTMWQENALGRPIVGSAKSVLELSRSTLMNFMKRHYVSPRTVIAASGNLRHGDLVSRIRRKFSFSRDSHRGQLAHAPPQAEQNRKVAKKRTAQTHISLGVPTFPYRDKRRYVGLVLSNILGGGMSSRLFQGIREKLGLVYSVYTFLDFFEDAGVFGVYMGTDKQNTSRVIQLVLKEIDKLRKRGVSSRELSHAKYQLKGSLLLSMESTFNRMNRLARYELFLRDYVDLDQTIRAINKIRSKDLIQVADELFSSDKLSAVALGPLGRGTLNAINWDSF